MEIALGSSVGFMGCDVILAFERAMVTADTP